MIACRVLGPIDVTIDGAPAPAELLWRKHLALLVYLARSPKRARTREHLCGLLWPDKDESAARHSLNEALRVLRRSGAGDWLDTSGGQVRLPSEAVALDADQLDRLTADGAWDAAAAIVAGEFLEGFGVPGCDGFEDWLAGERRYWTARSLAALLGRSAARLREGDAHGAYTDAARAESLDPASSEAAGAVMAALTAQGNPAAALQHAERFLARLVDLGGTPDQSIQILADRIRRGRNGARRPPGPAPGPDRRRAPLVGRSGELRTLLTIWEHCRAGGGAAAAVLSGDAGTGKSRLIEELAGRVELEGGTVCLTRCVEADRDQDGSGAVGLARGGLLSAPGLPAAPREALSAFASAVPEWAERFPGLPAATQQPHRALPAVVAAAAGEGPLLLAIDDAIWMDRPSLLAMLALLRDLPAAPVCLVFAIAPALPREELDDLRHRLGAGIPGATVPVPPLGGESLRQLAAWALPGYDAVALERVARRVASDSAGLPFLAVELLSAVAQGLDLKEGAAWPAPSRTLTHTLPSDLPDTVVAAIRIEFRRLGSEAQLVLGAAAVLGGRVTSPLLCRACDLPAERVEPALDELEWQRWLELDGQGYGFVAHIARQVVASDMITPGQRARILARSGRS